MNISLANKLNELQNYADENSNKVRQCLYVEDHIMLTTFIEDLIDKVEELFGDE